MDHSEKATPPGDNLALTGQDAIDTRHHARELRVEATRKVAELEALKQEQVEALKKARADIEAEFARKKAELEAQVAPLREQLARVTEILWTVDLYLGRDESITQFSEGAPAPADTPITIRQRVLSMAEESLIHLDAHGGRGMDADGVKKFLDWVASSEDNLNQVLPEQKGVVVLVPTKIKSNSDNSFERSTRDAENSQAHWLIRNGENLFLIVTDENLAIGERVLPRRDEFTSVFEKRLFGFGGASGRPVEPGSEEWMAMEKRASALQRHYMRVVLVLQGLIDRTTVWHPLPEGGVSLLSLKDQDHGKIVLLQDEDPGLQLGDGRESFQGFRARLNARLRPGLRVILATGSEEFGYLAEDHWRHTRISPANAEKPTPLTPYVIEGRKDGGLVIRYERTDEIWKRNVPVEGRPGYVHPEALVKPSRRASLSFYSTDSWVLPMDLATTEELRYYLNSREARSKDLLEMVPLIKAALAVKEAEEEAEKPFRDLLERQFAAEELDADVDALIHDWKVRTTYARPLNGDQEHEAKAAREIIREAHLHKRAQEQSATMVPKGRAIPGTVAVALHGLATPRWVALVPVTSGGLFYDIHSLSARKDAAGPVEREVFVGHSLTSRLIPSWSTDEWSRVLTSPLQENQVLSPSEAAEALAATLAQAGGKPLAVTVNFDRRDPSRGWLYRVLWMKETQEEGRAEAFFEARTLRLNLGKGRALMLHDEGSYRARSLYRDPEFDMSVPWAGVGHEKYTDARDRLIWSDPEQMEIAKGIDKVNVETRNHQRAEERRAWEEVNRWRMAIEVQVGEELERLERARFLEDFGPGRLDLWEGHLKSRQGSRAMKEPWRSSSSIQDAVRRRLRDGQPIEGVTLGDLLGDHLTREEFGGFVVSAPEAKGE